MVLSMWSNRRLEDVRQAAGPDTPLFMQLTLIDKRPIMARLVRRAEAAGYSALIVTIDQPFLGKRMYRQKKSLIYWGTE